MSPFFAYRPVTVFGGLSHALQLNEFSHYGELQLTVMCPTTPGLQRLQAYTDRPSDQERTLLLKTDKLS